ncbi:MAG: cation:dicarboxylase symporter family transporter [Acidobacteriota bacterium]|jgi:Na+/H+-dicarboxylate symporter|nr:cation:dicarboxylase symporter family transporter [Acidobacteriota bacterium]
MAENKDKNIDDSIPPDGYERELMTDLDDDTPDKPKGIPLHTKILAGLVIGVVAGLIVNWTMGGDDPRVEMVVENFTRPVGQLFLNLLLMIVVPLVFASLVVGVAGIGDIRKLGRIGAKSFGYTLVISAISVLIGLGLANIINPGNRIDPAVKAQLEEKYAGDASQKVSDAINVGAVSLAYSKNAEKMSSKFKDIAADAGDAEATKFAGDTADFAKMSAAFAEDIKKSYDPLGDFSKKADELTASADKLSTRTDVLGIEAANFSRETKAFVSKVKSAKSAVDTPLMEVVKTIVPKNVFYSIAGENPNMLHIMFFALIVGIAITLLPAAVSAPFVGFMEAVFEITAKIIDMVMKFAPYAVACLLFNNIALFGLDLLQSLAWFVFTVLLGLSIHFFGTYSLSIYFLSGMNPIEFFKRVRTVILTAFSTSSSNATLPTALRVSEENLGVPKDINSFVLTVGATANQNGTALYEGVTVLFLAQLAGIELTLGIQLMVVYLAILGGIGTAGVPSGSIPFIIGILAMIGVNPALIAIIIGVDRVLDMCRTTLNVVGDITAATYVAKSEGYDLLKHKPKGEML